MKDKIEIDGQEYVLASSVKGVRESVANNKYVIVRTYSAGVFAGEDVVEYGSGSGDGSGDGSSDGSGDGSGYGYGGR